MGFGKDLEWNARWLRVMRLKPDGTLWATGTHHIIFSLGFALQSLGYRVINNIVWEKPNATPNVLHTAFTHLKVMVSTSAGASPRSRNSYPATRRGAVW